MTIIAPSILSANFTKLEDDIKSLDQSSAQYIHIDIMDGSFVPNISFGFEIVKQIRPITNKTFDVHLMVQNPEHHVDNFIVAGADIISFHYEATNHPDRLISYIKSKGVKAGIAINPHTSEEHLKYLLYNLDQVIIMTVNPGFGGQKFLTSQLSKISSLKNMITMSGYNCQIEIDGGVSKLNSKSIVEAGGDILVAGSSVFSSSDHEANIKDILNSI